MVVFLVLVTILRNSLIDQKNIIQLTNLSERTVRNSIRKLSSYDLVSEHFDLYDLRKRRYSVNKNQAISEIKNICEFSINKNGGDNNEYRQHAETYCEQKGS